MADKKDSPILTLPPWDNYVKTKKLTERVEKLKPQRLYRELMRRNRELEQIIRMLKKEQERNALKAAALVMKYPEVAKAHKKRK